MSITMEFILQYLVFPLISICVGGYVVYLVTTKLQAKKVILGEKIDIFNKIYSAKDNHTDYDAWKAFAMVPIIFSSSKEICNLHYEFLNVAQKNPEQNPSVAGDLKLIKFQMLEAMAIECKLVKKGYELPRAQYYPVWMSEMHDKIVREQGTTKVIYENLVNPKPAPKEKNTFGNQINDQ